MVTLTSTMNNNTLTVTIASVQSINYLAEGSKFYLNGANGNTYFISNATTKNVELWVQGTKVAEWSHD